MKLPTLILSVGHHANDTGAETRESQDYHTEHDLCVMLTYYATSILNMMEPDIPIVLIPPVRLQQKVEMVNQVIAEANLSPVRTLAVEVHMNAHTNANSKGIEAWTYPRNNKSDRAARALLTALADNGEYRNRGVKRTNEFTWLAKTDCHAVLLEVGFITNNEDMLRVADPKRRWATAQRLALGLQNAVLEIHAS